MNVARGFVLAAAVVLVIVASTATAAQYETLLSQSQAEQKRILQTIINSAGYPCPKVTLTLLNGVDDDSAGYWAAACSDGGNWQVQVKNDSGGTTSVTPCALLKRLNVECWQKF